MWINGREKKPGEIFSATEAPADSGAETPAPAETASPTAAPDAVPAPEVVPSAGSAGSAGISSQLETAPTEQPSLPLGSESPVRGAGVTESAPGALTGETGGAGNTLAAVRGMLKETKTGAVAGKLDILSNECAGMFQAASRAVQDRPRAQRGHVRRPG